jgi:1,2-diacylglycerol 3-alpha-glucosyltransferase
MKRMGFVMARPGRAQIRRAVAAADVVHLQFPFWISFVALDEAKRAGRRVIAAFHVQPENVLSNIGIRSAALNRRAYRLCTERLFNRADAVVCPTEFAARKLRDHGLSARTFVVSNGVPPDMRSGSFTRDPRFHGKFLILTVGRLAAEKRHDVVIEAIRRSRHADRIQLVVAGAGALEEQVRARGATLKNPAIVGFLPREELRRYFFTSDLCVHASEVELEGISVVEAMSAGLPVLIAESPESAAADFALNDRFLFRAGDAEMLARRIDALIEHPEELAAARGGYSERVKDLDFGASVRRLEAIYREVLG